MAQFEDDDIEIEIPVVIVEEDRKKRGGGEIDLANIVQSAAKGVTTVQEAPAIVTVITEEEILQRGHNSLESAIDTVPGWFRLGAVHSQFPFAMTRGTMQSMLYMHNGISMFDPFVNAPSITNTQPMEMIKRIEVITGPGGVLWGANSYLGIMNVITKDASDVDGIEASASLGSGPGGRNQARAYVMAGIDDVIGDESGLLIHTSFATYKGAAFEMPLHIFSTPLPQPNSSLFYGPLTTSNPEQSYLFNLNAKLTKGNFAAYLSLPWAERHTPLGFPGFVTDKDRAEDDLPECSDGMEPFSDPNDACEDKDKRSRDNRVDFYDRYLVAEYRTRSDSGKSGGTIKAYATQFVRDFKQLGILPPVPGLLEGGIAISFNATTYRTGAMYDGDYELTKNARLLYGAEAFHEFALDNNDRSRQGDGIQSEFVGPYRLDLLPTPCPRNLSEDGTQIVIIEDCPLTFSFPASRTVLGAYVNPQLKVGKRLTLDGGIRLQAAPEALGQQSYDLQTIFSGALVYKIIDDWHFKFNYAEGFRPPVFNNIVSNGEAVQLDGRPDMEVEYSQAVQAEINARLFKDSRRIRELNFRLDYSYTKLENLIQIVQGRYDNTADRGIHSAEFLAKLYIDGGHQIDFGYTWLQIHTADIGRFRSMPEHYFNLAGFFNISGDSLFASTNLRVTGAMEDPNRLVEHRNYGYGTDNPDAIVNNATGMEEFLIVEPHELVLDRLPPGADLTLGLTYTGIDKLVLSAWARNAFNARYYQPDGFHSYEPRLEFLPNPNEDFRFQLDAIYTY
jgi:outer membrane receptor protein involved in Fe transport